MHGSVAKHIAVSLAALIAFAPIARADYQVKDGNATLQTIKSLTIGTCNGLPCIEPTTTLMDASFNPFGVSNNPIFVAPGAGQTFPVSGTITCSNCSGSGVSATFGAAIGTLGAPGGYKDGSGNFQPLLGDVTNGLWVSLKQSVSLGVTGTFWPYTLGQQVAGSSVPVALPATQITALTPPAAITGFALETGGNLASINTKTPALGQALAASSVPVVLTALQLTALTPPTTVTANLGTLNGAALAANQTNASQKTQIVDGSGNVIASTSNNLNVQCANCSGSGASAADAATFTPGTSTFAPAGGEFTSGGATACVTGHQCLVGITAARAFLTDLSSLAGVALGGGSSYGTSPGAVNVMGVNAFITNTPTVTANAGSNLNTSALSLAATQGTTADAPATLPATVTPASEIALLKAIANSASSAVPLGSASGGWTPKLLNALSTTVTAIKASAAGQLGMLQCSNSNAATVFVQVFDAATTGAVTLGTTVPKQSFEVPPGTPNGFTLPLVGMQFSSGIMAAATTTATGNTAQTGTLPNCNAAFS